MTDFVARVTRPEANDYIIRSLFDEDFYKETMGLFAWTYYPDVEVTYTFINRHPHIPLARIIDEGELRAQLHHPTTLRVTSTEISTLRGMDVYGNNMFPEEYLAFRRTMQLPPCTVERVGDQYQISVTGPWKIVKHWETLILAIVNELLYRTLMRTMTRTELSVLFARATDNAYHELRRIKERPHIRLACFGHRRRFSFLWQQFMTEMSQEVLGPKQFIGTSNTLMAFNNNLTPIGTNAHSLRMVLVALAEDECKVRAQYEMLPKWEQLFPHGGLRIDLPDAYGTRQYLHNMPRDLAEHIARTWRGDRLDSGNLHEEGDAILEWQQSFGVDPMKDGKLLIPSDGLDVDSMFDFDDHFRGRTDYSFGVGTNRTNNFRGCHPRGNEPLVLNGEIFPITLEQAFSPHSFVCKVTRARKNNTAPWRPCVKLSNNPKKATGDSDEVWRYLKIFGDKGRTKKEVLV